MNYDDILKDLGEFGRWQMAVALIVSIPNIFDGIHVLFFAFTGLKPQHGYRCRIPECDPAGQDFQFGDFGEDIFGTNDDGNVDYCKYKTPSLDELGNCVFNKSTTFESCKEDDEFAYNTFEFESTVVTDFNLVCENQSKLAWIGSSYMIGYMVGSFLIGWMADRFGRSPALLFSLLVALGSNFAGAFMPEYYSYTISRLLTGFGAKGVGLAIFSILVEIVGTEESLPCIPWKVTYKTVLGVMYQAPFAIGFAVLSGYASLMPDWRTLQWSMSVIMLIQLPLWYLTPESPRWLIATNRFEKAKQVISKAAKLNGRQVTFTSTKKDVEEKAETNTLPQYGYKAMISPELRWITLILCLCWPLVTLVYYGITFSVSDLSEDIFVNNAVSGLIELPAYVLVVIFLDLIGRKPFFVVSLLFCGVSCISVGVLEEGAGRVVMAMAGKFFSAISFAVVYMYSAELYPTTIRASAVGFFSFIARVGAIIAPQLALTLPAVSSEAAPYYVMGSGGLVGGLLALFLPETLGSKLPETLEDVEAIKKTRIACSSCKKN